LNEYLTNYFKENLKSFDSEPITVARDTIIDMLTKVMLVTPCFTNAY